ncbi:MAG TPA: DUF3883 domain-containing protein [Candidatus Angelobacter sp.]|nr:DUF3883 domain-containing protein [Candidatus Angelobacter sp.]
MPAYDNDPIILVQNEVRVNKNFDFWVGITGESYQFPNQMNRLIREGRRFIYYKGTRRKSGKRGLAHYFGTGVIGAVEQISIPGYNPKHPPRRCDIEEYVPFPTPVPAIINGEYLEKIHKNQWAKVRRTSPALFEKIIQLAGVTLTAPSPSIATEPGPPLFPSLDITTPSLVQAGNLLLKPKPHPGSFNSGSVKGNLRRSKYSKALGDRAEEIALKHLRQVLSPELADTLKHLPTLGQTPGWDIQYGPDKGFIAVEVKGTTGRHFSCVEMTTGEWTAAKLLRSRFHLMLVSECDSTSPQIEVIKDPYGQYEVGLITPEPLTWRLQRNACEDS